MLPLLFTSRLQQGTDLPCSKIAICVRIPKAVQTGTSNYKNITLISIPSALNKTFENILTTWQFLVGNVNGSIGPEQMASIPNNSGIDAQMINMTAAQAWLDQKQEYKNKGLRLSWLANGIDGAFNYIVNNQMTAILKNDQKCDELVHILEDFNNDCKICHAFNGEQDEPAAYRNYHTQDSPLLPILHTIYSGAINPPNPSFPTHNQRTTSYVDHEVLHQAARTQINAKHFIHGKLTLGQETILILNIRYSPAKSKLMHLIPQRSGRGIKMVNTIGVTL